MTVTRATSRERRRCSWLRSSDRGGASTSRSTTISIENHEINVTPFIDVMLVLLDHLHGGGAARDGRCSPSSCRRRPRNVQPRPDKPIFLTVKTNHTLTLGDDPVNAKATSARCSIAHRAATKSHRVFLRADKRVTYDTLMQAMNELRAAGYLKIALVGLDNSAEPVIAGVRPGANALGVCAFSMIVRAARWRARGSHCARMRSRADATRRRCRPRC